MTRYRWEPDAGVSGRYRDTRTGRFVPAATVRRELDTYIDASDDAARALTKALRNRELSLADWELAMRREIKRTHLNAIALERGGWGNMRPADYGRAGQIIREQYAYLRRFAQQIADGTQRLDGRAEVRAQLYTSAGRQSYYASAHANRKPNITHVRSIRHARDSCRSCIELDGRWFTIGDPRYMIPGRRECNARCRCSEEFGAFDAEGALVAVGTV